MSKGQIKIELDPREDQHGRTFYVGRIQAPILIDCEKGASFLVFISEEGNEEIRISTIDKKAIHKKKPKVYHHPKKENQ